MEFIYSKLNDYQLLAIFVNKWLGVMECNMVV